MNSKVSIVKCKNYDPHLIQQATKRALDLLGGVSSFIKPESKVLVKPNLLMAKEPEFGIDTHPEVVRSVVKVLKEIKCKIFVGDSPSVWGSETEHVDEVYARSGIKKVAEEEEVSLVSFNKRRWRGKFPLTTWLDDCDYLVSVPKFKTHELTLLTGAIKNLYGLVSGTYKLELHKNYFDREDFARIIVDIYQETKPALTVIDGVMAMEGDGPGSSGKLRNAGLILAGPDCVALDSVLALIMGLKPLDVLTTKEAANRALGASDINAITVLGEKLEEIVTQPFLLPATSKGHRLPPQVVNLAKKLIRYYPCVERDNCTQCAICINSCPNRAISSQNRRIVFDYGKCIACFCCQEACPNAAIKVKKSIFAKLVGL